MRATQEVVWIYVIHFHTCALLIVFLILDEHPGASPGKYTIGCVLDERRSPCLKDTGRLKQDVQLANWCLITLICFLQICSRVPCHQLHDNGRRDPKVKQCRCNEIRGAPTLKRKHFTSSAIDPQQWWNHDTIVVSTHILRCWTRPSSAGFVHRDLVTVRKY